VTCGTTRVSSPCLPHEEHALDFEIGDGEPLAPAMRQTRAHPGSAGAAAGSRNRMDRLLGAGRRAAADAILVGLARTLKFSTDELLGVKPSPRRHLRKPPDSLIAAGASRSSRPRISVPSSSSLTPCSRPGDAPHLHLMRNGKRATGIDREMLRVALICLAQAPAREPLISSGENRWCAGRFKAVEVAFIHSFSCPPGILEFALSPFN
jgi:hypothetical protein